MRHRRADAILLLYPRRVRKAHGPEMVALIDDLVAHEGRSRAGLFVRLAVDGLIQRIASTATAWTLAAVLAATSFGGLALSDFATASCTRVCRGSRTRPRPSLPPAVTPHRAPTTHFSRQDSRPPGTVRNRPTAQEAR
jgi:hypothetical protein